MTTASRLTKVEAALTPKEGALVWLQEAKSHGSLMAYMETLRGAPMSAFPLQRLSDQVEASVRANSKGKSADDTWQAVRMAVRDVSFLDYLVSNLNFRIMDKQRERWLQISFATVMLNQALDREREDSIQRWAQETLFAAQGAYTPQRMAELVARRYFDGHSPLFPQVEEGVARQARHIEEIVGICNDIAALPPSGSSRKGRKTEPSGALLIDLTRARAEAETEAEETVAIEVDLAKSAAWRLVGEQERGYPLVERHVFPGP
jgi:hypothetical protein